MVARLSSSKLIVAALGLASLLAACGVRSTLGVPPADTDAGQGGALDSSSFVAVTAGGGFPDGPGPMTIGVGGTPFPDAVSVASSVASSSSSVASSSSSGGGAEIACGATTCISGDVCCFNAENPAATGCNAPGGCGKGSVTLACMGGGDCAAGEVCCAIFQQFGPGPDGYKGASCQATCENPQFGQFGLLLCTDDPTICPKGSSCKPSQVLPKGFLVCAP